MNNGRLGCFGHDSVRENGHSAARKLNSLMGWLKYILVCSYACAQHQFDCGH